MNGQRIQKNDKHLLWDRDEISLGAKFTTAKTLPKVSEFIDKTLSKLYSQPTTASALPQDEVERVKAVETFQELLEYVVPEKFHEIDVYNDLIIDVVGKALVEWQGRHRFPAYKLSIVPKKLQMTESSSQVLNVVNDNNDQDGIEVNFEQTVYDEKLSSKLYNRNLT